MGFGFVHRLLSFFSLTGDARAARGLLTRYRPSKTAQNIVMVESWLSPNVILGLSKFLPLICNKYDAKPISFYGTYGSKLLVLKEQLRNWSGAYGKIGIFRFHHFNFGGLMNSHYELADDFITSHGDPEAFQNLRYDTILIGDLVYDSFLRGTNSPTIDFQHEILRTKLAEAILYVDLVRNFLRTNHVSAVLMIESSYTLAIPGRVAMKLGIETFVVSDGHFYRLSEKQPVAFRDHIAYSDNFASLPDSTKSWAKSLFEVLARDKLVKSFGVSLTPSKLHFQKNETYKLRKPLKLLVASHDFFDSPHYLHNGNYPDFYHWLKFISLASEKTNYQWFIRVHPAARPWNLEVLESLFSKSSNVIMLPANMPKSDLLKMEFSAVLTNWGTVGSEWPLIGVPVLSAHPLNPHRNLTGNFTTSSKEEYENTILNLDTHLFYEKNCAENWDVFLFMTELFRHRSLITPLFDKICQQNGIDADWARGRGFGWRLVLDFLKQEQFSREELESAFNTFIDSGRYSMTRLDFGRYESPFDYTAFP